jgi:hypothetical protein
VIYGGIEADRHQKRDLVFFDAEAIELPFETLYVGAN